ncbi:MAG: hypothetical protein ABL977_09075 [Candidatus Eisenbacteria bacterium]
MIRLRLAALLLVLGILGLLVWRAELFTVAKPGDAPRPLARSGHLAPPEFDVSLPMVPVGVARLTPGDGALLVHYWAPWERHSRAQITALDSLMRVLPEGTVRLAVVTFDPFPSVARYLGRLRVHTPVMLDLRRDLQRALPCPSMPYTWLLDERGHVLVSQAGEVDWLSPATRALLMSAPHGGGGAVTDSTLLSLHSPR